LPAMRFLETHDPEERMILAALARKAIEVDDRRQRTLAAYIVNGYVRVRRRG